MSNRNQLMRIGLFLCVFSVIGLGAASPANGQTPGACCTCPAICQEVADEADCTALDGVFRAGGTCVPNTCPGVPVHDDCASAIVISGVPCGTPVSDLVIEGDNICATDDGPPLDADPITGDCASSTTNGGEMHDDVWYRYTAEYDGTLTINGCQSTDYDQMIAVYDATTGCPALTGGELACNDDGCGTVGPSYVVVDTAVGDELLIRVGGWNDEVPGGFSSMPRGDFSLFLTYSDSCSHCRWLEQGEPFFPNPPPDQLFVVWPKNRYITLSECGPPPVDIYDVQVALEDTLVSGVTAVGSQWWAYPPDENCISVVGPTRPATPPDWSACSTFHVTGCPIIPTSSYIVTAMTDTLQASPILAITQAKPGVKWWGDCVGHFNGTEWTPPQGTAGIDDAVAIIKTWQSPGTLVAVHVSIADLHAGFPMLPAPQNQINKVVNFDDVFAQIQGFSGFEYPGPEIHLCPDP